MVVANATGCSSIFGGNLPTTPWATNHEGCGPVWANSLFEDNAEFGLGIKLAFDKKREIAINLLTGMSHQFNPLLVQQLLNNTTGTEVDLDKQRALIGDLRKQLSGMTSFEARQLSVLAEHFITKSHWIIGGDGWAYDIGFSGLDHVLSTGVNVNILVLDTEVYSNTGGQKSKSTPLGASAKFSVNGKTTAKKDLAMQAIAHGSAYVGQIAMGANDIHAIKTLQEAEAFDGPSIVIAYSHCIAHGYDLSQGADHQQSAVKTGYWPLFRYNPSKPRGERFVIDSKEATLEFKDFLYKETRFSSIKRQDAEKAEKLLHEAEDGIREHWSKLEALRGL